MITYQKNMGRFTHNQLKNRSLEEIQMLYEKEQKWIDDFVPMDSELEVQRLKRAGQEVLEEPVKRQKIREASGSGEEQSAEKEKELSEEELQKLLVVVPVEEVYVEALQVKYPIIDWEVYSEDTRRYWKIIRVGNHTEAYQIFAEMLKKFDRDDLVKLWDLVKERFSTTEPTDDKEKELWVELKRLFEPDNDDILWKLQRYMHDPLVWRLYDTCGVHHVSSVREHDIFMLDCGISKSPGPDGFTFEFYHKYWSLIDHDVVAAVTSFFSTGSFPPGCNSSFITLIPKSQEAKMVKDFRPISLIGSMYKIITKVLANRLSLVISELVSDVQSAFVSNRHILDGPFILNELLSWCKHKKSKALIFKIDFEKAFDSVRWDYLDVVLANFGFGLKWRSWIQGCLNSAMGSILVNGSPTSEFKFSKGLKQGDPLSPFLFILIMESLHLSFNNVILVQQYEQFIILEEESIDSGYARFNTIITSLKPLDEDLSSLALDELIDNLKIHEVVMEKDFEIYRGKKERIKSIALKAKKESSDDETSTSRSNDEEYAMAIRNFKKFFRRKGKFVRQPREEKKSFRQRDEKKRKSDRKCFRCGDPNHLIGDCPKPSRNKDQKSS
ncbi:RNA-directed DNA polymerase, eukaryota [Tanacetum coccineum]